MTKSTVCLLLCKYSLLCAVLYGLPAQADHEGTLNLYLNGGKYWFDSDRLDGTPFSGDELRHKTGGGFGLGYNVTDRWVLEGVYDSFNGHLRHRNNRVSVQNYRLDLLYQFAGRFCGNFCWQPYAALGVGEVRIDSDSSARDFNWHRRQTMVNFGLGIKYKLGPRWQVRADARAFQGLEHGGLDGFVSVAIGYQWGADPVIYDRDFDGVYDDLDQCPQTPPGLLVYEDGCPLDGDGDGVPDYFDRCPNTFPGVPVDRTGCARL